MFTIIPELQVLYSIIRLIAVDMVDNFIFREWSSKMLFHNISVLKNKASVNPYPSVSPRRYIAIFRSHCVPVTFLGAEIDGEYNGALSSSKYFSAKFALQFNLLGLIVSILKRVIGFESMITGGRTKVFVFFETGRHPFEYLAALRASYLNPMCAGIRSMLNGARMTAISFVRDISAAVLALLPGFAIPDRSFCHDISPFEYYTLKLEYVEVDYALKW